MIEQKEKFYLTEYQKTLLRKGKEIKKYPTILRYRKNGKTKIQTELLLDRLENELAKNPNELIKT